MKPDIGSESKFLPTQRAFDAPVREGFCQNIAITFGTEQLDGCGRHGRGLDPSMGWIGLGRKFSRFGGLGWVGFIYANGYFL